jgi:hypothetical protein
MVFRYISVVSIKSRTFAFSLPMHPYKRNAVSGTMQD